MSENIELKIKADSGDAVRELQKVSKELTNVEKESKNADKATSGLSGGLGDIASGGNKAASSVMNMGSNLKGMAGKATAALAVLTAVYSIVQKSNEKYVAYAKAVKTTDFQLKSLNVSAKGVKDVHEFLNKTMEQTGYQVDQVTAGYNSILSISKNYKTAQEDLNRAIKLSVATNKDLIEVSRALAKARQGDVGDLKEMLLLTDDQVKVIEKLKDNTSKYNKVLEDLSPILKQDINPALDDTDKLINQISSSFDRGAESTGRFFRGISNALAAGIVGNDSRKELVKKFLEDEQAIAAQGGFKGPQLLPDVPVGQVEQPINGGKKTFVKTDAEMKASGDAARNAKMSKQINELNLEQSKVLEDLAEQRLKLYDETNPLNEEELEIANDKLDKTEELAKIEFDYRLNVITGMSEELALRYANIAGIILESDEKQKAFERELERNKKALDEADKAAKEQESLDNVLNSLRSDNDAQEDDIQKDRDDKNKKAEEKRKNALRAGAAAAVTLAEVVGAGERELAFLKGSIEAAESIAAFADGNIPGGIGHAAASVGFFAAAGKSGGSGGSGGGGSKASMADLQAQRIEAQKQNTMALKEAFSDALKEANNQGRNITYVINQNGTYLGNDNTSLIRIKETLDGTQRLQFRS